MLSGSNGILNQAIKAKNKTEIASELEQVRLAVISAMLQQESLDASKLQTELKNAKLTENLTGTNRWLYKGNTSNFIIEKNGNVIVTKQNYLGVIYGNNKNILPASYEQIEYLKSTGNQIICFDYIFKDIASSYIKLIFEPTSIEQIQIFFGTDKNIKFQFPIAINETYRLDFTNGSSNSKSIKAYMGKTTVIIKDSKYEILFANNISEKGNMSYFPENCKFAIGGKVPEVETYCKAKYYYLEAGVEDKEVIKAIPALDPDGTPCMFDTVSNQSFYNQGTGVDFSYGPKVYNCVGNKNDEDRYEIPIELETIDGNKNITITLNEPLRKFEDKADYLDLANKEVVRLVKQDTTTGDLSELTTPVKESINIENIDFNKVNSIKVNTDVEPSSIE